MGDEARARGCVWAVVGGVEDHVHVLAAMPTTMTVSDLVRHLKGWSTRAVRERGIGLRWQAGYAAFSVSPSGVPQVEAYIRGQEAHHANGSVEGSWEWND
jgi:REP element-mobilizing transposase RayT